MSLQVQQADLKLEEAYLSQAPPTQQCSRSAHIAVLASGPHSAHHGVCSCCMLHSALVAPPRPRPSQRLPGAVEYGVYRLHKQYLQFMADGAEAAAVAISHTKVAPTRLPHTGVASS
jgi:hypothetical protein